VSAFFCRSTNVARGATSNAKCTCDFKGIKFEELIDFYHHEQSWTNRTTLGKIRNEGRIDVYGKSAIRKQRISGGERHYPGVSDNSIYRRRPEFSPSREFSR